MTFQPSNSNAVFLPTTIQYPTDPKELINRLNKAYEDMATRLNSKEIGIYDLVEVLTGQQWFTSGDPQKKRQTFRKVFEFGAIAPGILLVIPHGITGIVAFTHIYGTCITVTPEYRPLPYVDIINVTNQILLKCDPTNIVVGNGGTAPAITSGFVVLEYLLN